MNQQNKLEQEAENDKPQPCGQFRDWAIEDNSQQKTPNSALGHSQYSDEQQSSRDDFITKGEDNADTPIIPFKPIEPEKCRAYASMPEALKKLLCSNCNHFGRVQYQLGFGTCLRYKDGKI